VNVSLNDSLRVRICRGALTKTIRAITTKDTIIDCKFMYFNQIFGSILTGNYTIVSQTNYSKYMAILISISLCISLFVTELYVAIIQGMVL
jgi:hypothetical protein